MIHIKRTVLISCYMLMFVVCMGQQDGATSISVSIKMDAANSPLPDSILLRYAPEYFPGSEQSEDRTLLPDAAGNFFVTMNVPAKTGIAGFHLFDHGKSKLINNVSEFYTAAGDSIAITLKRDEAIYTGVFTGRGSSKYNCKTEIDRQRDLFFGNPLSYTDSAGHKKLFTDNCIRLAARFIDSCKSQLEPAIYKLLMIENSYFYYTQWMANIKYNYGKSAGTKLWANILAAYRQFSFSDPEADQVIKASSSYYILHELDKCQFELLLNSNNKGYQLTDLYGLLKEEYTGLVREKLLLVCLGNSRGFRDLIDFHPEEYAHCISDAHSIIKEPYLASSLQTLSLFGKGALAYRFSLPDQQDKKVSLDDLADKVILLDVWGDGCSGCAGFYRKMKTYIYPHFKDRQDFKVVSVSINDTKESWIKGIKTGRYTDDTHINVFTEGQGINHPFTKFYNLQYVPLILLIDRQGKIYSKIEPGFSAEKVIELIEDALFGKM